METKFEEIITPCTKNCVMNHEGYCTSCHRNMEEIANWGNMTNEERKLVMAKLVKRQEKIQKDENLNSFSYLVLDRNLYEHGP